jgi:bud emergence protein 1
MKVRVLDYTQLNTSAEWVFVLEVKHEDNSPYLLKRTYQDFYRFHMSMLRRFPGYDDNGRRIIPFMIGPEKNISLASTQQRAQDMNVYVLQLCNLPLDKRMKSDFIMFFKARAVDNSEQLLNYGRDDIKHYTDERVYDDETGPDSPKQTKFYTAASVKAKIKYGPEAFGLRISEDTRYESFKRKIYTKFSLKTKNTHRICLHLHSNQQPLIINDDIDLKEAFKHLQQGRAYFFIL